MVMNVIIAPHPDDEVIGCFQQLQAGIIDKVIYVENISMIRKQEAIGLCHHYNIDFTFLDGNVEKLLNLTPENYYIPSPSDGHYFHCVVFRIMQWQQQYRGFYVYSTRMNDWFIREIPDSKEKLDCLNTFYPSQWDLWKYDHRYFLFEGLVKVL